ncbi:MAG TPA: hypothetical protein VF363_11000 [Candidatus Eisenbacteria bacterium]
MDRIDPMQRRRFVKLMAAGAASLLVPTTPGGTLAAAAAPPRRRPGAPPETPPAIAREVAKQKKSLADTMKVIRDYVLPPGSAPASVFRAMKRKER